MLALLAVEVFLILSEWFRWFPFNQHKGWTLVIGLAAVVAAVVLLFLWFLAALIFRSRFQYSIRSLLVLTLVVATACSWLAVEEQQARKQREVVEEIWNAGGSVWFDYQLEPDGVEIPDMDLAEPPGPAWLRNVLGDDMFVNVLMVNLWRTELGDARLEHLKVFTKLQWLYLWHVNVGDAGLEHLRGFNQLRELELNDTGVSDTGVEYLEGLTQPRT